MVVWRSESFLSGISNTSTPTGLWFVWYIPESRRLQSLVVVYRFCSFSCHVLRSCWLHTGSTQRCDSMWLIKKNWKTRSKRIKILKYKEKYSVGYYEDYLILFYNWREVFRDSRHEIVKISFSCGKLCLSMPESQNGPNRTKVGKFGQIGGPQTLK